MQDEEETGTHRKYDPNEDLENFLPVMDSAQSEYQSSKANKTTRYKDYMLLKEHMGNNERNVERISTMIDPMNKVYIWKNFMNILTTFAYLLLLTITFIYCLSDRKNFIMFYEQYKTDSLHMQIKFELFITLWVILIRKHT
jgi:hypothetical protein